MLDITHCDKHYLNRTTVLPKSEQQFSVYRDHSFLFIDGILTNLFRRYTVVQRHGF